LVDHINGNRQDYNISNLEWVTPRENGTNKHKKSIQTFQNIEIEMTGEIMLSINSKQFSLMEISFTDKIINENT
jgi:hypothetical protein